MSKKWQEIEGIITFVADDFSHGFVKVVPDFSKLDKKYLFDKKIPSYRFIPDKDAEPENNQIIRISFLEGKKDSKVISNTYLGLKETNERIMALDKVFIKDKSIILVKDLNETIWKDVKEGELVDFFMYFDPQKEQLVAQEVEKQELTPESLKIIEDSFVIACRDFENINKYNLECILKYLSNSTSLPVIQQEGRKLLGTLDGFSKSIKDKFITLFGRFGNSILDVTSAKKLYDNDIQRLIKAWIDGVFPDDFISLLHLIAFHEEFNLRVSLPPEIFTPLFNKLVSKSEKDKLLETLLSSEKIKDENLFNLLLKIVKQQNLNDKLYERLISSVSSETVLKLWRAGNIQLSISQIKSNCFAFSYDDFKKILDRFKGSELHELISGFQIDNLPLLDLILEKVIDPVLKELNYCIFDTEVNPKTEKIDEYAWITNEEEFEELDINEETLNVLRKKLFASKLVIGHNIETFDYKYVFSEDVKLGSTWDTLKIEVFLDPTKKSYALITDHEAFKDCENTKRLFLFQICRLKRLYSEDDEILEIVPGIADVFAKLPELIFTESLIDSFNKSVFRIGNSFVADKIITIVPKQSRLLVTPRPYWSCFKDFDDYLFKDDDEKELNLILSHDRVKDKLKDYAFLLNCVERYLENCNAKNEKAYARRLSPYLVSVLEKIIPLDQLCGSQEVKLAKLVVSPHYYVTNRNKLLTKYKVPEICFLGIDQWKYESQKLIKILTTEELEEHQQAKELWVHFSNGASLTQLSNEMANALLKDKLPDANYWLEKCGLNQYKLMSSIPSIEEITKSEVFNVVNFDFIVDKKNQTTDLLFFKARINGESRLELNPETLYRDIYWNERLQIIVKLMNAKKELENNRIVLVVQKKLEVTVLQKILKDLNIYCPNENASIQRRLELLEDSFKGVLVCDFDDLEQILLCSSNEPVTIILESMRPNELLIHSGRSVQEGLSGVDHSEKNEERDEEDKNTRSEEQELPHMGSAVKKLPSLYDYYGWLTYKIKVHNVNNQFATIDPRVSRSSFSRINVETIHIDIENEFDSNSKVNKVISSRTKKLLHVPKEFKLGDLDAHLARISAIFLKGKGDGSFLESQREYLDYIMPADQDVLVTLPTGTGKSVLFQGPSLYRSSYTGKLSIVVTPLKALMEDHVYGLWRLGFWNSVEYINSDKGLEVKDIYRRIAGGELLMVFVTPERFRSKGFISAINQRLEFDGSFEYIVFDEAHCISQWGSEFRPDYFYCAKQINNIRKTYDSPILLLSATVTKQVAKSIEKVLYD